MNGGTSFADISADQHHLFLSAAADNCIKLWDVRTPTQ
jgi:WD40 repeat protein